MNTKDDLLEAMRKDYNKGGIIPEKFQTDLFTYAEREKKKIGREYADEEENEPEEEKNDIVYA